MPPVGSETSGRNAALTAQLYNWSKVDGTGKAFAATAGFRLPNGATRKPALKDKMREYMANGAKLGFLIDPIEGKVHAYRPDRTPELSARPIGLSAEPEMPGLVFDLTDVW
jgi:Uma2 family endonuclease